MTSGVDSSAGPSRSPRRTVQRRADRRRRILVAGLLAGALVAGAVAWRSSGPAAATAAATPAATPTASTPLWSARRWPGPAVALATDAQVRGAVTAAMSGWNGCAGVRDSGRIVAADRTTDAVTGASTQKLLTSLAALRALGPEYRYQTEARATGGPDNGVLDTLYVVGGGDPVLQTNAYSAWKDSQPTLAGNRHTSLEDFAAKIAASGVTRIDRLVGDDTRYSDVRFLPDWAPSDRTNGEVGPLGALTVDAGFASFVGTRRTDADDPALLTLTRLRDALRAHGVTVGDSLTRGPLPPGTRALATIQSPPLAEIVGELLRSSDNTVAELVLLEIGHHVTNSPGTTTAEGIAAVRRQLTDARVPTDGLVLLDGSGLGHANRVTCAALLAALATRTPALFDGLAVAGRSGTLVESMRGTRAEGRFHGKTGTLTGVSALTGTFGSIDGPNLAVVLNGDFATAAGVTQRNRIAVAVADALVEPDPNLVVPGPGRSAPPG